MTKTHSAFYSIIITAALNIAFFFCNYYPRHIIEIKDGILAAVLLTLTNLLHFALMGFMLILAFGEGSCIFSERMYRRFLPKGLYIKKLLLLLAAQILIDAVRLVASGLLGVYSVFWDDITLLAFWLAAYLIISDKESRFYSNKRRMIITAIAITAAVGVFALLDALSLQRYHLSCEKYTALGTVRSTIAMNLDYTHHRRLMILDCILGAILIIAHSVKLGRAGYPKKKTEDMKPGKLRIVSIAFLRISLIAGAVFVFCLVKMLICPDSSDTGFSLMHSSSYSIDDYEGEFSDSGTHEFSIEKYSGTFNNRVKHTVYSVEKTTLYFEKKKVAALLFDGDPSYCLRTEDGALKKGGKDFVKEDVGGITVWIYCNRYLCWEENGKPIVLRYEDIAPHKENITLTAVCERLIEQGNVVAFDFAAEYLKKYDRDFIEPYIKRYAAGDFTETEQEFIRLYEYREEYFAGSF